MMVGLPDSTRIDELNTAKDLAKLKPKIMRIYPVLVLKNTQLEKDYLDKKYEPLTVGQAVERCKELCYFFGKKHITVIRIGLQNTENICNPQNSKSEVVAGPYHETFRQLVESSMWYDNIVNKIKEFDVKVKEVEITVNPHNVNNIVGYKRENIEKLKEFYEVDVVVKQDFSCPPEKIEIKILKKFTGFLDEKETV